MFATYPTRRLHLRTTHPTLNNLRPSFLPTAKRTYVQPPTPVFKPEGGAVRPPYTYGIPTKDPGIPEPKGDEKLGFNDEVEEIEVAPASLPPHPPELDRDPVQEQKKRLEEERREWRRRLRCGAYGAKIVIGRGDIVIGHS
ncbi:hypothetical protein HK104_010128 [Borealophlyctis nickersoniae]|nr:hypothetical protein HK104_010128 [Borealophlyctis nickersoniae]